MLMLIFFSLPEGVGIHQLKSSAWMGRCVTPVLSQASKQVDDRPWTWPSRPLCAPLGVLQYGLTQRAGCSLKKWVKEGIGNPSPELVEQLS